MNVTLAPIESSLSGALVTTIIIGSVALFPLLIIVFWCCIKCCSQKRDKEVLMDYTDLDDNEPEDTESEDPSESMERRILIKGRHGLVQNKLK